MDYRNYTFETERALRRPGFGQQRNVTTRRRPVQRRLWPNLPPVPTPLPFTAETYALDQLLSQVDNSFATSFYQPFTGAAGSFPGLSGLLKIGISDLFEDIKWVGGIRLAGSLQNSTFVVSHKNLERKVDREWIIERQGNEGVECRTGRLDPDAHPRRALPTDPSFF